MDGYRSLFLLANLYFLHMPFSAHAKFHPPTPAGLLAFLLCQVFALFACALFSCRADFPPTTPARDFVLFACVLFYTLRKYPLYFLHVYLYFIMSAR